MLIRLAFGVQGNESQSLRELENGTCNTPDQQHLSRFLDEHSYLIYTSIEAEDKYVLEYYSPGLTNDFFLNPSRSRHLYSTSLVLNECQRAITKSLILDSNPDSNTNFSLLSFFKFTAVTWGLSGPGEIPIVNATHLLESTRNGPDRHELLLFLKYLSEIPWFDIYLNRGKSQRDLTNTIVHWVCTTLVD